MRVEIVNTNLNPVPHRNRKQWFRVKFYDENIKERYFDRDTSFSYYFGQAIPYNYVMDGTSATDKDVLNFLVRCTRKSIDDVLRDVRKHYKVKVTAEYNQPDDSNRRI